MILLVLEIHNSTVINAVMFAKAAFSIVIAPNADILKFAYTHIHSHTHTCTKQHIIFTVFIICCTLTHAFFKNACAVNIR